MYGIAIGGFIVWMSKQVYRRFSTGSWKKTEGGATYYNQSAMDRFLKRG